MAAITEASNSNQIAPSPKTLLQAARMAIDLDKPICLDYYVASYNKNCKIARDGTEGEKFLYKNPEEYTSPLKGMFKVDPGPDSQNSSYDLIFETQNSIYLASGNML
tara:strand:+ start:177 stop:497 length:321 start_codon:yes stop_codon:yes gene_type:complete